MHNRVEIVKSKDGLGVQLLFKQLLVRLGLRPVSRRGERLLSRFVTAGLTQLSRNNIRSGCFHGFNLLNIRFTFNQWMTKRNLTMETASSFQSYGKTMFCMFWVNMTNTTSKYVMSLIIHSLLSLLTDIRLLLPLH